MNGTLATVLITIAAVKTVNFIVLFVDESVFYRKYEDRGKRICCLFPFLLVNLVLVPATLCQKLLRRRQRMWVGVDDGDVQGDYTVLTITKVGEDGE